MPGTANASWARHSAMTTLPRVAQQREWLQSEGFLRYGIDWVRRRGMGGREMTVDQATFAHAVASQWFRPLTILSSSATAALRSAATSLSDEVLPQIFPYDIPDEGIAFLPETLHGNADGGTGKLGVSVLGWTHCDIEDAPGVFITSWVSDNFGEDPDVSDMHFSHALQGRSDEVAPRYLLKHAEPFVCGREVVYGKTVRNLHREETTPVGMTDPDPRSFTPRLLYGLWSMLAGGTLVGMPEVDLPPHTARLYLGERINGVRVAGVEDEEVLLTARKDRVVDPFDDRHLFAWNVSSPEGGRII